MVERPESGPPQIIPRPVDYSEGPPAPWVEGLAAIASATGSDVRAVVGAIEADSQAVSAVVVAMFEEDGELHVVLTRRASSLRRHSLEVAFPGGKVDRGETAVDAAVREAHEEVGLRIDRQQIVGTLDPLTTVVSPTLVLPVVVLLNERPLLVPNADEVEFAFTATLVELAHPDVHHCETWTVPGRGEWNVHFFKLESDTVWGATAKVLADLLTRLSARAGA
jgi:8-oxo-dGTP pyrophosphatase MutT (NUDIX family)